MCSESQALRKRTQQGSAPDASTKDVKRLQPFAKNPVGLFTSKVTSPKIIRQKHNNIDARKYLVAQAGLENFIRSIVAALNLTLPNTVRFNMNGQGRMETWEDVYMAEVSDIGYSFVSYRYVDLLQQAHNVATLCPREYILNALESQSAFIKRMHSLMNRTKS